MKQTMNEIKKTIDGIRIGWLLSLSAGPTNTQACAGHTPWLLAYARSVKEDQKNKAIANGTAIIQT